MRNENTHRLSAYVHLPYGVDPDSNLARYEAGERPDRSPYGFHHAESMGFAVSFSSDRLSTVAWRLSQVCRRLTRLDPVHGFANRRRMAAADVIWTMGEWDAMVVRAMMAIRLVPRRPVIGTAIWIVHQWEGFGALTRLVYGALLRWLDLLVVHTDTCLAVCREQLPDVRSELMHFGIAGDTFLYAPAPPSSTLPVEQHERVRIVAAGNDVTRDWGVLLRAFGNDPSVELVIIDQKLSESLLASHSSLTLPRRPSIATMIELYRSATYIAVPLHANIYSGITVALEAMAMGVPVISTRTGGVPTYMSEEEALYVPVGDVQAWRDAVRSQSPSERQAMAERARRRFERDDYTTVGLMRRFAQATRVLLDRKAN